MRKICVNGKLVTRLQVQSGAAVEVKFDEESMRDVWFPATAVEDVGNGSFLVEYQSSKESGLVKVVVDCFHIRKPPPSLRCKDVKLLEKVDWFDGFGWRIGVVTKVLADGSYIVFFKSTRKEKNLSLADIRPHIEWADGEWINLREFDVEDRHPMADEVTRKNDHKEEKIESVEKSPCNSIDVSSKRIKTKKNITYMRGNLNMKSTGETLVDACMNPEVTQVKTVEPGGSKSETVMDSLIEAVGPIVTASVGQSGGGNLSPAKLNRRRAMETKKETESTGNQNTKGRRRRGRPPKVVREVPQTLAAAPADEDLAEREANYPIETPVVLALSCSSESKPEKVGSISRLNKVMAGKAVNDEKSLHERVANNEENKEQYDSQSSLPKRKRGRPAKLKNAGSAVTQAASEQTATATPLPRPNEVGLALDDSVPSQSRHRKHVKLTGDQTNPLSNAHRQNDRSVRSTSGKRGRRKRKFLNGAFMTAVNQPSQAHVFASPQAQTDSSTHGTEDVLRAQATHAPDNGNTEYADPSAITYASDDDKPLSTWFGGVQFPQELDDARVSPGRCKEVAENQNHIQAQAVEALEMDVVAARHAPETMNNLTIESTAIVPFAESTVVTDQDLPFVKNTLVWKTIESMEVFRFLPQKPHFLPLYDCKEETREGLAIGNMVTFAGLVEKVAKFRLDDPRTILNSSMETLADLEKHGFDVEVLRSRLRQLLSIKSSEEEALNTMMQIEEQILDRTNERVKIQEEIAEIDKMITELQKKRSLAVALEESKTSEIHALQSSVAAVNISIDGSRAEFNRVAAAPW